MANGRLRIGQVGPGQYNMNAEHGAYALTGQDATLTHFVPGGGSFTPLYANTFSTGTLGAVVPGMQSNVRYSNDISGPFGEPRVAKITIAAGADDFGGTFQLGSTPTFVAGDQVWMRVYHYFPSSFCSAYGTAGDGWGNTKWLRLQFGSGGSRLTMQLGQFGAQTCNPNGPCMWGCTHEAMLDGTNNSNLSFASNQTIPRNTWAALQWNILFGNTAATSRVRMWIGSTFVGQPTMEGATLPSAAFASFIYGDYWNGDSWQSNEWYIGNTIITKEQPDTVDSGGRPYISPSADAADF